MTDEEARIAYLKAVADYELEKATKGAPTRKTWEAVVSASSELHKRRIKKPI